MINQSQATPVTLFNVTQEERVLILTSGLSPPFSEMQVFTPPGNLVFSLFALFSCFFLFLFSPTPFLIPPSALLEVSALWKWIGACRWEQLPSTQREAVPTMGAWQIYHLLKEGGF